MTISWRNWRTCNYFPGVDRQECVWTTWGVEEGFGYLVEIDALRVEEGCEKRNGRFLYRWMDSKIGEKAFLATIWQSNRKVRQSCTGIGGADLFLTELPMESVCNCFHERFPHVAVEQHVHFGCHVVGKVEQLFPG